jgi:hypothetical protein
LQLGTDHSKLCPRYEPIQPGSPTATFDGINGASDAPLLNAEDLGQVTDSEKIAV